MKYNLLELDGTLLKAWELDKEYQDKLFAVFPNEIEKIEKKELIVHFGELPQNYIIENFEVVKTAQKEKGKEIVVGGEENEFYI